MTKEKGGSGKSRYRLPTENSQSVNKSSHSIEKMSNLENSASLESAEVLANIRALL